MFAHANWGYTVNIFDFIYQERDLWFAKKNWDLAQTQPQKFTPNLIGTKTPADWRMVDLQSRWLKFHSPPLGSLNPIPTTYQLQLTWWRLATCQIIHHISVRINMICTKWPLEQLDPNLLGFSDDPKQLLKISKHEQSKKMIHRIANLSPWINLPSDPRIFNAFKKGPFTRVLQIAGQRVGTIAWQLRNHGIFEAHQL